MPYPPLKASIAKSLTLFSAAEKPKDHAKDAGTFGQLVGAHVDQTKKLAANQQVRVCVCARVCVRVYMCLYEKLAAKCVCGQNVWVLGV